MSDVTESVMGTENRDLNDLDLKPLHFCGFDLGKKVQLYVDTVSARLTVSQCIGLYLPPNHQRVRCVPQGRVCSSRPRHLGALRNATRNVYM